mmetsp:Transcript_26702/g.57272  ORF Transcript_26702/g.57272 Transcript_26702/m.57272 type:complete len:150 (+) Transcript_26702:1102-1551(+)
MRLSREGPAAVGGATTFGVIALVRARWCNGCGGGGGSSCVRNKRRGLGKNENKNRPVLVFERERTGSDGNRMVYRMVYRIKWNETKSNRTTGLGPKLLDETRLDCGGLQTDEPNPNLPSLLGFCRLARGVFCGREGLLFGVCARNTCEE